MSITTQEAIEIIKALVPLAWPLLLAIILWRLFPLIKFIISSRELKLKVGDTEISFTEAAEKIQDRIEDLQQNVIKIRHGNIQSFSANTGYHRDSDSPKSRKILWVDDNPSNNVYEVAYLQDRNVTILDAYTTKDALELLRSDQDIKLIISDMGRNEGGVFRSQAGLALLKAVRRMGIVKPFLIYTSQNSLSDNVDLIHSAGGDGATASAIDLLDWIESKLESV